MKSLFLYTNKSYNTSLKQTHTKNIYETNNNNNNNNNKNNNNNIILI